MPHARRPLVLPSTRSRPQIQRPMPPTTASSFGLWTREPRPGVIIHIAGEHEDILELGPKAKRADRVSKWLGPDLPKEVRDSVVADVTSQADDGTRDDFLSRWTLSNARVDSYNSTLAWDGWKLGDFKRNPVVLLAHDSYVEKALPIGEDVGAFMDPVRKALIGLTRYVSQSLAGPETLEARAVRWIKARFLRAVSVGFEPLKWEVNEERDDPSSWFVAVDFLEQALREYSPTPVPANPDSLADGRAFKGLSSDDIAKFADDIERALDGEQWLAVPRATLEQMRSAIRGTRMQVEVAGGAFVLARADDPVFTRDENGVNQEGVPDDPQSPIAPAEADDDPEERMKCPACGYEGPESQFLMPDMGGETEKAAPTAAQMELAALLSDEALSAEIHRRHHAKHGTRMNGALDSAAQPVNAAEQVARAAALVGPVIDAMDAQANGRLP